jgi:hypothetical protein
MLCLLPPQALIEFVLRQDKMGEDRSSVIKRSVGHAIGISLWLNYFTSTNNEIHVLCTCRKSSDNCYLSHKLRC